MIAISQGIFHVILVSDPTFISFFIILVWFLYSPVIGYDAYLAGKNKQLGQKLNRHNFVSEACQGLGLLGTVIGFIIMLSVGTQLSTGNAVEILNQMLVGSATAMWTTLTGIIASLFIRWQYVLLED